MMKSKLTNTMMSICVALLFSLLSSSCIATLSQREPRQPQSSTVAPASALPKGKETADTDPDQARASESTGESKVEAEGEDPEEEAATSIGRLEYFQMLFGDANGNIPADGMLKANEHVQLMRAAVNAASQAGAGVNKTSWTYIGPGKTVKNGNWNASQLSGHVEAIVVNPANLNMVWIGAETGGIWKSTDAGVTWRSVNDFLESMIIPSMVVNPANPTILYAGTGARNSGVPGVGILKSTDSGDTWAVLEATRNANFAFTAKLAIANDGNTLLAATVTGLWRSTDGGATWGPAAGIANNTDLVEAAFNPADNSKAVAAGRVGSAWYSTNGGANWTQATGLPTGRTQLAYAASSPNIVYASVNQNDGEVWKSTDGGQSYARTYTGGRYLNGQGWYGNVIWVDPTNPNIVIIGGMSTFSSNDGGVTFAQTRCTCGPDQHVMISAPGFNGATNKVVYAGNDGGLFRADDVYGVLAGAATQTNWTSLNEKLGISQVYGVSVNAQGVVLVGLQDNGTMITANQTGDWMRITFGDGGYSFADPTDARYFYNGFIRLGVERSADSGGNSEGISTQAKGAPYFINDTSNFITPILLDPNNPERLLVGAGQLWRTNDARAATTPTTGPQWAAIKAPLASNSINALAIAKGNSDIVWVGHNQGELFKTTNGTAASPTWTQVAQGKWPRFRSVNRITIDPQNANNVYVALGGYETNNIWRTTDGGATWAAASGAGATALPALPVMALAIHPNNANWLYAGTVMGLFTSEDGGATWKVPHDGPTNAMIWDLSWSGTTLYAASYGRGVWKAETTPNTQVCFTLATTANPVGSGAINVQTPPNCNGTQYTQNTIVTVQAAPNANQAFTGWAGDLTGTTNPTTITMNGNKNITANFATAQAACFALTLTATNGNITAAPAPNCNNGTQYTQGTVVNLTAVANDGFTFGTWSGAATGTANPVAVTMDAAKAVTANFGGRCVKLTYGEVGNGVTNITGDRGACATGYPWGSTVNLTVVPDPGNDFTGWRGDALGVDNPLALLMNADKDVTAVFDVRAPNDNIAQPLGMNLGGGAARSASAVVGTIGAYSVTLSTLNATSDPNDPTLCASNKGAATVWFTVTAPSSGALELSTEGTQYGTVLSIWTGTPDALKLVGCIGRHTYDGDTQLPFSRKSVQVEAGQTYYIEVADCALPEVFEDPENPIAPAYYGGRLTLTAILTPNRNLYLPFVGR
ncbi:MAG: hypothetical protein U0350_37420 [Caldilineaceae bacterium]